MAAGAKTITIRSLVEQFRRDFPPLLLLLWSHCHLVLQDTENEKRKVKTLKVH